MSSHSGSSVKDVLNKEELSSLEERVHAKAPQIFSNGCSMVAETVTTVKANTQNREFEIWLTFAWQYVWWGNPLHGFLHVGSIKLADVMDNEDRTCAPNMEVCNTVMDKYSSEETLRR